MDDFTEVSLEDIREMARESYSYIHDAAAELGRDIKIYLHWTAGWYGSFFDDYHFSIDENGKVFASTDDLSVVKNHTYMRNTGSVSIAMNACAFATTDDLGENPPTDAQIESMAQVIAVLATEFKIPINIIHVMTHAEAADNMDGLYLHEPYGPENGCERWDLAILHNDDEWMSGGDTLRGKAIWYQNQNSMNM